MDPTDYSLHGPNSPLEKVFGVSFIYHSVVKNSTTNLLITLGELKHRVIDLYGLSSHGITNADLAFEISVYRTDEIDDIVPLYQVMNYGSDLSIHDLPMVLTVTVLDVDHHSSGVRPRTTDSLNSVNTLLKVRLSDGSTRVIGNKSYDLVEPEDLSNPDNQVASNEHLFLDQLSTSSKKFVMTLKDEFTNELKRVELSSQQCIIVDDEDPNHQPYILLNNSGRRAVSELAPLGTLLLQLDNEDPQRQRNYLPRNNDDNNNNNNNNNDDNNDNNNNNNNNDGAIGVGMNANGNGLAMRLGFNVQLNGGIPIVFLATSVYRLIRHMLTSGFVIRLGFLIWLLFKYIVLYAMVSASLDTTLIAVYCYFILTRQEVTAQLREIIDRDFPGEIRPLSRYLLQGWTDMYDYFVSIIEVVETSLILLCIGNNRPGLIIDHKDDEDANENEVEDLVGDNDEDGHEHGHHYKSLRRMLTRLPPKLKFQPLNSLIVALQDLLLLVVTLVPSTFLRYTIELNLRTVYREKLARIEEKAVNAAAAAAEEEEEEEDGPVVAADE